MICPRCKKDLELSAFGISRTRREGHGVYCKKCNRERMAQSRAFMKRKPSVLAPHEKVLRAIRRGNRTREAIRRAAQLSMDDTMDTIADLALVKGVLLSKRINDEPHFYERVA